MLMPWKHIAAALVMMAASFAIVGCGKKFGLNADVDSYDQNIDTEMALGTKSSFAQANCNNSLQGCERMWAETLRYTEQPCYQLDNGTCVAHLDVNRSTFKQSDLWVDGCAVCTMTYYVNVSTCDSDGCPTCGSDLCPTCDPNDNAGDC